MSAKTCRTTCRSAPSTRCTASATLNEQYAAARGAGRRWRSQYALRRRGPLTMAPSAARRVRPVRSAAYETPNIEYHIQPLSLDRLRRGAASLPRVHGERCNLRPDSRGSIHIAVADPRAAGDPAELSFHGEPTGASPSHSLRLARRIMAAPAMAGLQPEEMLPGAAHVTAMRSCARRRRHRHDHLPPGRHLPRWASR